jgi:hypothetical protein
MNNYTYNDLMKIKKYVEQQVNTYSQIDPVDNFTNKFNSDMLFKYDFFLNSVNKEMEKFGPTLQQADALSAFIYNSNNCRFSFNNFFVVPKTKEREFHVYVFKDSYKPNNKALTIPMAWASPDEGVIPVKIFEIDRNSVV